MSNPYDKQVGGDHYQNMKIQPAEFINKNQMKFAEGNAIKYICRHINKGGEQDLQKAKHYIDMIIERDYGDDAEKSKVMSGLPEGYSFANEDTKDIKITYGDLSISDDEGLPQDKTGFWSPAATVLNKRVSPCECKRIKRNGLHLSAAQASVAQTDAWLIWMQSWTTVTSTLANRHVARADAHRSMSRRRESRRDH